MSVYPTISSPQFPSVGYSKALQCNKLSHDVSATSKTTLIFYLFIHSLLDFDPQKSVRRRVLRGLVQRSASDIASAVQQMAGDGGEAKRLPKRPFHGEVDENSNATMNENVKIKPGKKTPGERLGKENSAAKCTALTSGSAEAKMDQTVIHSPQTQEDPSIFFDEDSNHIFPVEQFFGNVDVVQVS